MTCLFSIVVTELEVLILNCLSCFSWGPTVLQMEDIGDDCLDLPLLLGVTAAADIRWLLVKWKAI